MFGFSGGLRSKNLSRCWDGTRPRAGAWQKRSVRSRRSLRYSGGSATLDSASSRWPPGDDSGIVGHLANNMPGRLRFGHRFSFSGVRLVGVLVDADGGANGTRSFFRLNCCRKIDCFSSISGMADSSFGESAESSAPQNMTSSSNLQFLSCSYGWLGMQSVRYTKIKQYHKDHQLTRYASNE